MHERQEPSDEDFGHQEEAQTHARKYGMLRMQRPFTGGNTYQGVRNPEAPIPIGKDEKGSLIIITPQLKGIDPALRNAFGNRFVTFPPGTELPNKYLVQFLQQRPMVLDFEQRLQREWLYYDKGMVKHV